MYNILNAIGVRFFPNRWKKISEIRYWKSTYDKEISLSNEHYKYFYTEHFNLNYDFFARKKILDIGCGPRGSLEWADNAARRIGLDPLADEYRKFGIDKHKMEYIAAPAEDVPFPDSYFDVVCSFNSLDHVSDVDLTISEIKRVTKTAGLFLLLVEINHPPQECEPHEITPEIIHYFEPTFDCLDLRVYLPVKEGLYMSIKNGIIHPEPEKATEISWLSVMFKKN